MLTTKHPPLPNRITPLCAAIDLPAPAAGAFTIVCVLAFCWAAAEGSARLFQPPIGIESVFPVSVIRDSLLTELDQLETGYEIWGKEVVTQRHIPTHFSTPVSYPWEYSEEGAARLVGSLQQLPYVGSAQVEYFPSIHP